MARTAHARLDTLVGPKEVVTSAALLARLRTEAGVADAHARKLLQRQHEEHGLWRSEKFKMTQNERLFAHRQFVGTPLFFRQVEVLLRTARPGIARCLGRLAEGAVVHRVEIMKLLAAPIEHRDNAHRPAIDSELAALAELGVGRVASATDFECYSGIGVASGPKLDELTNRARVSLRTELVLGRILGDYIRRMNLVSWGRLQVGGSGDGYVPFNNQPFTAVGFSYLGPAAEWKTRNKPTGCPVLVDVRTDRCTLGDVLSFRERVTKATHRGETPQRSLGIIAARDFEMAALKEARRTGYMTVNFRQLYGEKALEAMQTVSQLLGLANDTSKQAQLGIPSFAALLEELKANPVVVRIRSIAFEAVTGLALQEAEGCHGIRLGLDAPFYDKQMEATTSRDVDVFGLRGDKAWVVECKAYHAAKAVDFPEVRRFFAEVVPAYLEWSQKSGQKLTHCSAAFWTTGLMPQEVRDKLPALVESVSYPKSVKMSFELLSGSEVKQRLPNDLKKQCASLLDAIATHASPEDDEEQ